MNTLVKQMMNFIQLMINVLVQVDHEYSILSSYSNKHIHYFDIQIKLILI